MYTVGQWVKVTNRTGLKHFLDIGKVYKIIGVDTLSVKVTYTNSGNYQWVSMEDTCPLFDVYLKQIEEYAV